MLRHRAVLLASVLPIVTVACAPGSDSGAPEERGRAHRTAVKSSDDTGAFPEVVEIDLNTGAMCTGTLIRADTVLTARHCFEDKGDGAVTGAIVRTADTLTIPMQGRVLHDQLDIAVVHLATPTVLGTVAAQMAANPAEVGQSVSIVGRTSDEADKGSLLFLGHANIAQRNATTYVTDANTNHGDSGGPMFDDPKNPAAFPHTLHGVLAEGIDFDIWVRVDTAEIQSWINGAASSLAAPGSSFTSNGSGGTSSDCGSITFDGHCDGDTLHFCDQGKLQTIACGDFGETCAPAAAGGFDCKKDSASTSDSTGAAASAGSCGPVTFEGQCDGDVLSWCDGGLQTVDCAAQGATCGFNTAASLFDCL